MRCYEAINETNYVLYRDKSVTPKSTPDTLRQGRNAGRARAIVAIVTDVLIVPTVST